MDSYQHLTPITFNDPSGYGYSEVVGALREIYDAKMAMNHSDPYTGTYKQAYKKAMNAKYVIKNSDVYIENWGELSDVLSPLINGNNNFLEDINQMIKAVENAQDAYRTSNMLQDMLFIVTTSAVMVTAIKTGTALRGIARYSPYILPLTNYVSENDLHHVFDNSKHNISGFLSFYNGNKTIAFNAIRNAAQIYVNNHGITDAIFKSSDNPIEISINGFMFSIGGRVVDGVFKLGTAFIK